MIENANSEMPKMMSDANSEMPKAMPYSREPSTTDISMFTNQPVSLAMAYVPYQQWRELYEKTVGFQRGTIFKELDKPFIGEEAVPNDR